SSSKLSRDQTSNLTSSTNPIPKGRIHRSFKQKVENSNFQENLQPEVPMADNRTMAQLLQEPTEGYEDAIVIPEITAANFELKHGLINLVQNMQSSSKLSRDQTSNPTSSTNPIPKGRIHRSFKQKVENSNFQENLQPEVPMADNRTMAQLLQEPTEGYEDAIVIPEIIATNFELKHDKMPFDFLKIIERKSKVRQARAKAVVAKVNSSSSTPAISSDIAELKDIVRALLLDKKNQYSASAPSPTPALIKVVEPNCVTCGGTLSGNTITNLKEDLKGITTRSGVAYQGPTIPTMSKVFK
nr:reverse transcriptase domain-containing protein [Tanacetum cinerariifolium]